MINYKEFTFKNILKPNYDKSLIPSDKFFGLHHITKNFDKIIHEDFFNLLESKNIYLHTMLIFNRTKENKSTIHLDCDHRINSQPHFAINLELEGNGFMEFFECVNPTLSITKGNIYPDYIHFERVDCQLKESFVFNESKNYIIRTDVPHKASSLTDYRSLMSLRFKQKSDNTYVSWENALELFKEFIND